MTVSQLQPTPNPLPLVVDLIASLRSLANNEHVHDGMLKLPADLDRYRRIIEDTQPEVIVETGTYFGASARWFHAQGLDVITIDLMPPHDIGAGILTIEGDSANPATAVLVAELVANHRCMVSLDSNHAAGHVAREIDLYGPLVSPGCHLVVEDAIFGYAPIKLRAQHGLADMVGSPLEAIADKLVGNPDWSRDVNIEALTPVTHHPAGFWRKTP
jgi:cephalosporin hydroxylase